MYDDNQQAYDRGTNIFSPDGRLYQVEYAREAVQRGSPSVGVRTPEGVVLAAERGTHSPLMEQTSVEKLHRITDHIGIASAGHVADARRLIDEARQQAQLNNLRYGEDLDVETLTKALTDHLQQYTQQAGARPFGTSLLIGGVDNGVPALYEAEPSGTPCEWKAAAIGGGRDEIQSYLEANYETDLELTEGIDLALEALAETIGEFQPGGAAVATVPIDTAQFTTLTTEEVDERLYTLDLLTDTGESQ